MATKSSRAGSCVSMYISILRSFSCILPKSPKTSIAASFQASTSKRRHTWADRGLTLLVPYGGFLAADLKAGEMLLVSGATGNFGSSGIAVALAMGAGCVVAPGRNETVLSGDEAADRKQTSHPRHAKAGCDVSRERPRCSTAPGKRNRPERFYRRESFPSKMRSVFESKVQRHRRPVRSLSRRKGEIDSPPYSHAWSMRATPARARTRRRGR